jgi:hypothetical protein
MIRISSVLATALIALTACSALPEGEAKFPTGLDRSSTGGNNIYERPDTIWGKDGGPSLFGGKKQEDNGVTVNSYLWRAALDTVSFMPLTSADPFGGVILTDWYSDPNTPNERSKLNVFILGRELKADGIRVKAFRQTKGKGGAWKDAPVAADTERKLEDAILTRARQMRVAASDKDGLF